jgi:hypothetical protein
MAANSWHLLTGAANMQPEAISQTKETFLIRLLSYPKSPLIDVYPRLLRGMKVNSAVRNDGKS